MFTSSIHGRVSMRAVVLSLHRFMPSHASALFGLVLVAVLASAAALGAQGPFEEAATKGMVMATYIARAVGIIVLVFGGLTLAFSDHGGRGVAAMFIGVVIAVKAQAIVTWLS